MFWGILVSNLPEIAVGLAWTGLSIWVGRRWERKFGKRLFRRDP